MLSERYTDAVAKQAAGQRQMDSVVFDLDGTLADTSADLIAAANACFNALGSGMPLDPVADALTAFHGGRAMLRLGFSRLGRDWDEGDVDREYPVLLTHYARDIDRFTRLYPGVEAALDRLEARGAKLGICTNKPVDLAEDLLQRLGIRDRFLAMLGSGSLAVRKPDPLHVTETLARMGGRRDSAVLIGDTITDRKAAEAAGIPCVLVTFGPEGQGVAAMAPEGLLDHYDDLDGVLAGLARGA
jgi:phosphoglycolate phosphatase